MDWSFDNSIPIYAQLVQQFKLAIVSGEFKCGEKLPGVRDFAAQAGVNPNTMQRAFAELERLGLVYTQRGDGRYVTEDASAINGMKNTLAEEQTLKYISSMLALGFGTEQILLWINKVTEEENGNL